MKGETRKAIIPAAGLGTRLLTATKEQPKEMLSVFSTASGETITLKPIVQLVFEQIFDTGIRQFCFVVGRSKRAIEDHFTPEKEFVTQLESLGKKTQARLLRDFYARVSSSSIMWVNQPEPKGFGDAVLAARSMSDGASVLVHAGDNYVVSEGNSHLARMSKVKRTTNADATLLLKEVRDPRQYGVAEVRQSGGETLVSRVVEKPEKPRTKLALVPTYLFEPRIFDALRTVKPGKGGEIQLTDGIQAMIEKGFRVNAVQLQTNETWLDVGTPETYWQALKMSHEKSVG